MNIRVATISDADAISQLLTSLSETYIISGLAEEGKRNLLGSMAPSAIKGFFDRGFRYHVGEVNSEIIGVVGTRDNSHLFHLFVHSDYQGQKYASALWEVGRTACIESGSNPGYFTVNSSLNAQEVYKGWGFTPIAGIREGGGVKDVPMRMEFMGQN